MTPFTLFQKKIQPTPSDSLNRERPVENTGNESSGWNLFEEGQLLVDMVELPDSIMVRSLVAGMDPDRLEISFQNDMLTIRGSRKEQEDSYDDQYLLRECYWGSFSRSVIIPVPVQADAIQASFKNGVVTIILPKAELDHSISLTEDSSQITDDESPYWEDQDEEERA